MVGVRAGRCCRGLLRRKSGRGAEARIELVNVRRIEMTRVIVVDRPTGGYVFCNQRQRVRGVVVGGQEMSAFWRGAFHLLGTVGQNKDVSIK